MNIITGDLIKLTIEGNFDAVAHGCNCFCTMKRGLAPKMAKAFNVDLFRMEGGEFRGDINKLGQIEFKTFNMANLKGPDTMVSVINAYTQYHWSEPSSDGIPLDYLALRLCLRKINHIFKGKYIGLPKIGCGLAGGDWDLVRTYIDYELKDCNVTIVDYVK